MTDVCIAINDNGVMSTFTEYRSLIYPSGTLSFYPERISELDSSYTHDMNEHGDELNSPQDVIAGEQTKNQAVENYLKKSNEIIEMGGAIDMVPLSDVRNAENYASTFNYILTQLSRIGKIKLLYELAQISFDAIFGCEQEFVVGAIKTPDLEIQEFALNTLEIWNSKSLIEKIGEVKIDNTFLQEEYDSLLRN